MEVDLKIIWILFILIFINFLFVGFVYYKFSKKDNQKNINESFYSTQENFSDSNINNLIEQFNNNQKKIEEMEQVMDKIKETVPDNKLNTVNTNQNSEDPMNITINYNNTTYDILNSDILKALEKNMNNPSIDKFSFDNGLSSNNKKQNYSNNLDKVINNTVQQNNQQKQTGNNQQENYQQENYQQENYQQNNQKENNQLKQTGGDQQNDKNVQQKETENVKMSDKNKNILKPGFGDVNNFKESNIGASDFTPEKSILKKSENSTGNNKEMNGQTWFYVDKGDHGKKYLGYYNKTNPEYDENLRQLTGEKRPTKSIFKDGKKNIFRIEEHGGLGDIDQNELFRRMKQMNYPQNIAREIRAPESIYEEDYEMKNSDMRKVLLSQDNQSNLDKKKYDNEEMQMNYDVAVIKKLMNENSLPAPVLLEQAWAEWAPVK